MTRIISPGGPPIGGVAAKVRAFSRNPNPAGLGLPPRGDGRGAPPTSGPRQPTTLRVGDSSGGGPAEQDDEYATSRSAIVTTHQDQYAGSSSSTAPAVSLKSTAGAPPATFCSLLAPELTHGLTPSEIAELEASMREDLGLGPSSSSGVSTLVMPNPKYYAVDTNLSHDREEEEEPRTSIPSRQEAPSLPSKGGCASNAGVETQASIRSEPTRLLVNFYPRSGGRDRAMSAGESGSENLVSGGTPKAKARTHAATRITSHAPTYVEVTRVNLSESASASRIEEPREEPNASVPSTGVTADRLRRSSSIDLSIEGYEPTMEHLRQMALPTSTPAAYSEFADSQEVDSLRFPPEREHKDAPWPLRARAIYVTDDDDDHDQAEFVHDSTPEQSQERFFEETTTTEVKLGQQQVEEEETDQQGLVGIMETTSCEALVGEIDEARRALERRSDLLSPVLSSSQRESIAPLPLGSSRAICRAFENEQESVRDVKALPNTRPIRKGPKSTARRKHTAISHSRIPDVGHMMTHQRSGVPNYPYTRGMFRRRSRTLSGSASARSADGVGAKYFCISTPNTNSSPLLAAKLLGQQRMRAASYGALESPVEDVVFGEYIREDEQDVEIGEKAPAGDRLGGLSIVDFERSPGQDQDRVGALSLVDFEKSRGEEQDDPQALKAKIASLRDEHHDHQEVGAAEEREGRASTLDEKVDELSALVREHNKRGDEAGRRSRVQSRRASSDRRAKGAPMSSRPPMVAEDSSGGGSSLPPRDTASSTSMDKQRAAAALENNKVRSTSKQAELGSGKLPARPVLQHEEASRGEEGSAVAVAEGAQGRLSLLRPARVTARSAASSQGGGRSTSARGQPSQANPHGSSVGFSQQLLLQQGSSASKSSASSTGPKGAASKTTTPILSAAYAGGSGSSHQSKEILRVAQQSLLQQTQQLVLRCSARAAEQIRGDLSAEVAQQLQTAACENEAAFERATGSMREKVNAMDVVTTRMDARLAHVNAEIDAIREEFYDGQTRLREVQGEISVEVETAQKDLARRIDVLGDEFTALRSGVEEMRAGRDEDAEKLKNAMQRDSKRLGGTAQELRRLQTDFTVLRTEVERRIKATETAMKKDIRLHARKVCAQELQKGLGASALSEISALEAEEAGENFVTPHGSSSTRFIPTRDKKDAAGGQTSFTAFSAENAGEGSLSLSASASSSSVAKDGAAGPEQLKISGVPSQVFRSAAHAGGEGSSTTASRNAAEGGTPTAASSEQEFKRKVAVECRKHIAAFENSVFKKQQEAQAAQFADSDRTLRKTVVSLSARLDQCCEKQKGLARRMKQLEDSTTGHAVQLSRSFEQGFAELASRVDRQLTAVLETAKCYRQETHARLTGLRDEVREEVSAELRASVNNLVQDAVRRCLGHSGQRDSTVADSLPARIEEGDANADAFCSRSVSSNEDQTGATPSGAKSRSAMRAAIAKNSGGKLSSGRKKFMNRRALAGRPLHKKRHGAKSISASHSSASLTGTVDDAWELGAGDGGPSESDIGNEIPISSQQVHADLKTMRLTTPRDRTTNGKLMKSNTTPVPASVNREPTVLRGGHLSEERRNSLSRAHLLAAEHAEIDTSGQVTPLEVESC
ncbi:unnamed protein product [Amoebophrya sp. A25]|nr:unnamed protein product [Amoebophrya sp. A25]|eukprot:GSA25T00025148001.1